MVVDVCMGWGCLLGWVVGVGGGCGLLVCVVCGGLVVGCVGVVGGVGCWCGLLVWVVGVGCWCGLLVWVAIVHW